MAATGPLEHLQHLQELNRAFLELLRRRAEEGRPCFGLASAIRQSVRNAMDDRIAAVALFPRALFYLAIAPAEHRDRGELAGYHDEAEHELVLSMLFAARHVSRQSAFEARLLFGLEVREIASFQTLPLVDLQRLAGTPGVLHCALRERQWFWHGLLTATRPEIRRQLTLMALQPGVAVDWPTRRPPHASA